MKGFFITFEGIDASGKSLQAERLTESLQERGYTTSLFRDPGSTPVSESIRLVLLDQNQAAMHPMTELFLYEAARAQLVKEMIRPALDRGIIVICDRFTDSTVAYQGYGRSLSMDIIADANRWACGETVPNRTYILDITLEESLRRRAFLEKPSDRMEKEQEHFFHSIRKGYRAIAEADPKRVLTLEGNMPMDDLSAIILKDALDEMARHMF